MELGESGEEIGKRKGGGRDKDKRPEQCDERLTRLQLLDGNMYEDKESRWHNSVQLIIIF